MAMCYSLLCWVLEFTARHSFPTSPSGGCSLLSPLPRVKDALGLSGLSGALGGAEAPAVPSAKGREWEGRLEM